MTDEQYFDLLSLRNDPQMSDRSHRAIAAAVAEMARLRDRVAPAQPAKDVDRGSDASGEPPGNGQTWSVTCHAEGSPITWVETRMDGSLWAGNEHREVRVNFCPFTGRRAIKPIPVAAKTEELKR